MDDIQIDVIQDEIMEVISKYGLSVSQAKSIILDYVLPKVEENSKVIYKK